MVSNDFFTAKMFTALMMITFCSYTGIHATKLISQALTYNFIIKLFCVVVCRNIIGLCFGIIYHIKQNQQNHYILLKDLLITIIVLKLARSLCESEDT